MQSVPYEKDLAYEPFDQRYFEASQKWLANRTLRQLISAGDSSFQQRLTWFLSLPGRSDYWIWGVSLSGHPIGCFGIKHIDQNQRCGEYWGYIGDDTLWGKKIGPWILQQAIQIAGGSGIEVLYLKVWEGNERAVRLYRGCGFALTCQDGEMLTMSARVHDLVNGWIDG